MVEVPATEAEHSLGALLELVEKGEEVIILKDGKRVARLISEAGLPNRERARQAAEAIMQMRKGVTPGGLKIKDLVNEGRP